LHDQLMLAAAERALGWPSESMPTNGLDFDRRMEAARQHIMRVADEVMIEASAVISARHEADAALSGNLPEHWQPSVADMRAQLAALVGPTFLLDAPRTWIRHVPRFCRGIARRVDKLTSGGVAGLQRDHAQLRVLSKCRLELEAAMARDVSAGRRSEGLARCRWLLEELRVSLFAQELKTSVPISPKRFADAIREAERQHEAVLAPRERSDTTAAAG
ncbi:MAG: DUF3418 domain-containing protein, partial [Planctomycetota bacterium]